MPDPARPHGMAPALDSISQSLQAAGITSPADLAAPADPTPAGHRVAGRCQSQVADGVALLVDQTKKLGVGLDQASSFLLAMKRDANTQSMAGFYIPPQILTGDEFKKAAAIFISPDGHTARYLVQSKLNPFTSQAMDQVNDDPRHSPRRPAQHHLADASIS